MKKPNGYYIERNNFIDSWLSQKRDYQMMSREEKRRTKERLYQDLNKKYKDTMTLDYIWEYLNEN